MKTTYLFIEKSLNGESCLVTGTLDQYKAISTANSQLPMDQRRHFIIDRIPEAGEVDVMYIEVDYNQFLDWARQYMAAYRNRQDAKQFTALSLDAPNTIDEALTMHDCVASSLNVEQEAIGNADFDILRKCLSEWKPWAVDLLDAYMSGEKKTCTEELAKKYKVSVQTIRKYKRQFEKFIEKYLSGVSF